MSPSTRRRSRRRAARRKMKKGIMEFVILALVVCAASFILAHMFSTADSALRASDLMRQQLEKTLQKVRK